MSPNMKISLLALAGAVAAVPHNNAHSRLHSAAGYAGPTGGWPKQNSTNPAPTGTGYAPVNEQTTTLSETMYSTETIVSTIYATKSDVAAADVSTGSAVCGPPTVYVTETEKVTVTVPAGGAGYASDSAAVSASASASASGSAPASASGASSAPGYIVVSPSSAAASAAPSTPVAVKPSSSKPAVSVQIPSVSATSVKASSSAPASSAAPSSVAPSSAASASSASSAAPSAKPSSTPGGYSGGKRGLAYRWDGAADCKSIASKMKAGFAWNWESDSRGDIGATQFIPTLRTLATAGNWATNVDAAVKAGSKVVFGFNEVDKADQANLGVAAACDAWKQYMNPIAAKHPEVEIVGPSVSSDVAKGTGLDWLSSFKTECPGAIYHSANIHWYGYGKADFAEFKTFVESAISKFGKVWVTEFALVERSVADSEAFLEKALAYLDSNDNCKGYSYFAVGQFDPKFNMLGTGSALSPVGKLYIS
jgi:hypothetical protein